MILGLDPLLSGDVGFETVLIVLVKVVAVFAFLLVSVILMIWFERKVISDLQNRVGPDVAGPWGLLQTLADGMKLIFKEDIIPDSSSRFVFKLAPFLSIVPAFLTFAIVPLGGDFSGGRDGTVTWFGEETLLQVADPPLGMLLFLAMSSLAVYGIMLAGWSSGSKYPLLGSVRASAQMVSYEAALGLSLAAVFLEANSFSSHDIVAGQATWNWNLWATGIVPFVVFLIAGTAELNRPPFDLVEAEQELVGGFHTEYSSFRFATFFIAEFMNTVTMSAIIVTLFFGGPNGPILVDSIGGWEIRWIWGVIWFFAKLLVFLFTFVWIRGTLPRLRYDQLMDLGWKVLIPLSLGWFLFLGALDVAQERDYNIPLVVVVSIVVMGAAYALLDGAITASRRQTAEQQASIGAREEVHG